MPINMKMRAEDYLKFSKWTSDGYLRTEVEKRLAALDCGKVLMVEIGESGVKITEMDKA